MYTVRHERVCVVHGSAFVFVCLCICVRVLACVCVCVCVCVCMIMHGRNLAPVCERLCCQ